MESKFQVGDMVMVRRMSDLPAEVVEMGFNKLRRVKFAAGDTKWVDAGELRSCAPPKFEVGDEVRLAVGGTSVPPVIVDAVDLLSTGQYRYTIGGAYYTEDKLRLSEYKFKMGDAVLVKDTQRGVVVGRKLFTDGRQEYTLEFSNGEIDYCYAEELTKDVRPRTAVMDKVRVKHLGKLVEGTVLSIVNGYNGSTRYTVQVSPDGTWGAVTCTAEELAEWAKTPDVPKKTPDVPKKPHRLQAAVDAVDVQRAEVRKQVEALQAKLTIMRQTKTVLLDMIREDAVGS